ncbi:Phosphoglycerate mutase [Methylobacterium sp. 4-46]|uniref:histidine phosphatase family protein n=1 Tax=unclassified Methylobacterium TaxID=2615210 RepID=UPI000152E5E7|nr:MULTISPECIES: histidine phosphatase family protein [Methylobacterium]ACA19647.1 Phosphoglycerate mutase [Methylobacterium sp. 4-46]WFT78843.1 histidine phosphatase family protein [Methylobacterium nodulans]
MSRPPLYFVRHGETDWNAEGRLQGQRDTPLNPRGFAQAEAVGERLAALLGAGAPEAAYLASPLTRTRQTMETLRRRLGLAPEAYATDPRLKELGFGAWEGRTLREIRVADPRGYAARNHDRWGHRPPGEGAESYAMLLARVRPVLDGLDGPTVMVAHGGVARAVLVAGGHASPAEAPHRDIWQGRVLVIDAAGPRWI